MSCQNSYAYQGRYEKNGVKRDRYSDTKTCKSNRDETMKCDTILGLVDYDIYSVSCVSNIFKIYKIMKQILIS